MKKQLGRLLHKWFNIEVRYKGNVQKDYKWLIDKNIGTILDVGANEGQFAAKMRQLFPVAQIYSFEPLPEVYQKLKNSFSNDAQLTPLNYALGEANETATITLNAHDASSSLLKMSGHKAHFSDGHEVAEVQIEVKRLDDITTLAIKGPLLAKLDVQGFEDRVINGGLKTIAAAAIIIIEVSFTPLYENQKLFHDLYTRLYEMGFRYHGNYEQLYSPVNNEVLQADAIFIKQGAA